MRHTRIITLLASLGFAIAAQAGDWTVAADTSAVNFIGEQQGSKFNGKFTEFTANIDFDPATPGAGSIVGTVVTESVDTRDYDRDGQLIDPDFFDSENHPEARFESESIEAAEDGNYVAHGQLTIKGTTKPIDLTFSFDADGGSATFDGTMTIDRFDFEVGRGWNDTYMVGKDVEVNILLDLSR